MEKKRMYKIKTPGKLQIGGVCEGLGEYFEKDPLLFRIGFVVLFFISGLGILIYLVTFFMMPTKIRNS